MKKPRFIIKLHEAHLKSGLTAYAVAQALNLNENTVRKYTKGTVTAEFLPNHVLQMVQFYGLDWHDPAVIEVIDAEKDESPGQIKTPLAALA